MVILVLINSSHLNPPPSHHPQEAQHLTPPTQRIGNNTTPQENQPATFSARASPPGPHGPSKQQVYKSSRQRHHAPHCMQTFVLFSRNESGRVACRGVPRQGGVGSRIANILTEKIDMPAKMSKTIVYGGRPENPRPSELWEKMPSKVKDRLRPHVEGDFKRAVEYKDSVKIYQEDISLEDARFFAECDLVTDIGLSPLPQSRPMKERIAVTIQSHKSVKID
jgi:hypothetical protein